MKSASCEGMVLKLAKDWLPEDKDFQKCSGCFDHAFGCDASSRKEWDKSWGTDPAVIPLLDQALREHSDTQNGAAAPKSKPPVMIPPAGPPMAVTPPGLQYPPQSEASAASAAYAAADTPTTALAAAAPGQPPGPPPHVATMLDHSQSIRTSVDNLIATLKISDVSQLRREILEHIEATRQENEAQLQEHRRVSEQMQAIREQMEAHRQELNTQRWEHERMMHSQTFILNQLNAMLASQLQPEPRAVGSVDATGAPSSDDNGANEPPESITTGTHGAPALEESEASPEHASAGSADSAGSDDMGFVIETPKPHQ